MMTVVKFIGKDRPDLFLLAKDGRVVGGHPAYLGWRLEEAIPALLTVLRRPDAPDAQIERAEVAL